MATPRRTCAAPGCALKFVPKRSTAKYHSAACRERARRSRSQPDATSTAKAAVKRSAPATLSKKKTAPRKTAAKKTTPTKRSDEVAAEAGLDATGLVASVRAELVKADAVDTFAGQLALQLASRLTKPDETGISSLSKELRTVMAAALQGATPPPGTEDETEDEVEKARRRREEARQAAGLS